MKPRHVGDRRPRRIERDAAFRAGPARLLVMLQVDVDLPARPLELHPPHTPRLVHPENLPGQLAIVHPQRGHDLVRVQSVDGIECLLDLTKSRGNARAQERRNELRARDAVAVLTGMRALVLAHERVRVGVRKPDVRLDAPVEHSAVTVERER